MSGAGHRRNRTTMDRAAVAAPAIEQICSTVLTPEKRRELKDCLRNRFAQAQRQAINVAESVDAEALAIEQIFATKLTLEQWQELKDYLHYQFAEVQGQAINNSEPVDA
jgi:hypothetical protein